jgi:hypothetical protein
MKVLTSQNELTERIVLKHLNELDWNVSIKIVE